MVSNHCVLPALPRCVEEAIDLAAAIATGYTLTFIAGSILGGSEWFARRPEQFAEHVQASMFNAHWGAVLKLAEPGGFAWTEEMGDTTLVKEAIGVVGCITPWNWPVVCLPFHCHPWTMHASPSGNRSVAWTSFTNSRAIARAPSIASPSCCCPHAITPLPRFAAPP